MEAKTHPPKKVTGTVEVPSFTQDDVSYRVHAASGACSCPRGRMVGDDHKHVRLARSGVPLEDAAPGLLEDGRRVVVLAHVQHYYELRVWGFDAGHWSHALCFDGTRFVVESSRISGVETRLRSVGDWRRWRDGLPAHASSSSVAGVI